MMKRSLRAFLLGFIPTFCLIGLAAGLCMVWVNTQSVLSPGAALLEFQQATPWQYTLEAFGAEFSFQLPQLPDRLEIFSRYPALLPRGIRLAAWIWDNLSAGAAYLREFLPY